MIKPKRVERKMQRSQYHQYDVYFDEERRVDKEGRMWTTWPKVIKMATGRIENKRLLGSENHGGS
jgi:hypothetical protein